jgi:hypothetical protein
MLPLFEPFQPSTSETSLEDSPGVLRILDRTDDLPSEAVLREAFRGPAARLHRRALSSAEKALGAAEEFEVRLDHGFPDTPQIPAPMRTVLSQLDRSPATRHIRLGAVGVQWVDTVVGSGVQASRLFLAAAARSLREAEDERSQTRRFVYESVGTS